MSDERDVLRQRIAANDAEIVGLVNERLRLVAALWEWKRQHGAERLDPDRERRLRHELHAANAGPLTDEGLDRLVDELLALTKNELGY